MKTFTNILSGLFLSANILIGAQKTFVQIDGKTNVNSFKCINENLSAKSAITLPTSANMSPKSSVNLLVKDFDCKNRMMNNDFRETLNADHFPNLNIRVLNLSRSSVNFYSALIEVQMMDRVKNYQIQLQISGNNLIGKKAVKFSDFKIIPPKKMGGMIVVKDGLNLLFSLPIKNN